MEQVLKNSEFVLDISFLNDPSYEEFINMRRWQPNYYKSAEFYKNGIKGKIEFSETADDLHVKCDASFLGETDDCDCYTFNMHVKFFLCLDNQDPIELDSESALKRGNQVPSGIQIKIPKYTLEEMNSYDDDYRVVLTVDEVAVQHPKPAFLKRFQSGEDSDVQLICEDEIFPAHTFILKTVSPVFRAMLEVPMKEAATGQIVITDLSADTVKKMLHYIYRGCVKTVSDAQVIECLYAAEKYELDSFKTVCLQRMVASMSDENITSFLEMSVRVNTGNEFIKQMMDYCTDRMKELRKREDFLAFVRANPSLSLKIGKQTSA